MMVKLMVDTFIKSSLLYEALVFILGIFKILSFNFYTVKLIKLSQKKGFRLIDYRLAILSIFQTLLPSFQLHFHPR
jgi:hypothetical protein